MTAPTASHWATDPGGDPSNDVDVLDLEGTPADILPDDPELELEYGDPVDGPLDAATTPLRRPLATVTERAWRPRHTRQAAGRAAGWLAWAVTRWWWANARHTWRATGPTLRWVAIFLTDPGARRDLATARAMVNEGRAGLPEVRRARRTVRYGKLWRWPTAAVVGYVGGTWLIGLSLLGWVVLATVAFLAAPVAGATVAPNGSGPLFRRRTTVVHQEVPRSDRIVFALAGLGIKGLTDAVTADPDNAVQFLGDIHPNHARTGWEVTVVLPAGTPAQTVIRRQLSFAGLINYPKGAVFLEEVEGAPPTWLRIVLLDEPLGKRQTRRWGLLDDGYTDFFRPIEVAEDQHGNPVTVLFDEASVIIGAIPGAGKTWAMRVMVAGLALDPRVVVYLANFKGGAGWRAAQPVCHLYRSSGDVGRIINDVYRALKPLQGEITRRGDLIEAQWDRFKSSKLTPAMADELVLGLSPIVIAIDEYHLAFMHPIMGKRLRELVEDLIRRGREYGIVIILATQKPSSRTTPTDLRDNMSLRIAMKLMAQSAHDMILGAGAWKNGWRTNRFPRRARGLALIVGEDDHPITCQFPNVGDEEIARVFQRAHDRRVATGRLTGEAAGATLLVDDGPESNPTTVDLLQVWPAEDDPASAVRVDGLVQRVETAVMVDRLAGLDPDRYGGWTAGQLTEDLAEFRWPVIDPNTGKQAVDDEGRARWRGLTDPKHVSGVGTRRALDIDELLLVNAQHLSELDAIAEAERAMALAAASIDDDDPEPVDDLEEDDDAA